jgi:hypothetical protein
MFESLASCFAFRCSASLLMTSFVSLSKSMRVKTTVGTPRCGVRSAQRADPTIRARQAICVISAPKITPNVLGNLNMTPALQDDFHTITRNFYSRLLNLSAFVGARHENRVRVVDVDVNLPARWRWTQHIKATVVDGQMIHLARAASARPYLTEFSVAPERPVKHDKIRCMNRVAQLLSETADTGREQCSSAGCVIAKLKCNAVQQFNRSKCQSGVQRLKFRSRRPPFDSAKPRQSAVKPRERSLGFVRSVNDDRLFLLAQEQQAQRMIDICIGQKNACDRSVARCIAARLQPRCAFDLPGQVRGGVD